MNFYKHYMGDYARDTGHLTMTEHGAYRMLLDHYYATERALPKDLASLYRICKAATKAERDAVQTVCGQFFPDGPEGRRNKRADVELGKREAQARINREVGRLGGRPKKTESVVHEKRTITESVSEQEPNRFQGENRNGLFSQTELKPNDNPIHSQSTSPVVPPLEEKPNRLRRKPMTLTPDSFDVGEEMWAWAEGIGVPGDDIPSETDNFLDHHRSKDSKFSDWEAAWRTWMRNVVKFRRKPRAA